MRLLLEAIAALDAFLETSVVPARTNKQVDPAVWQEMCKNVSWRVSETLRRVKEDLEDVLGNFR